MLRLIMDKILKVNLSKKEILVRRNRQSGSIETV